jgi:hypothetical protein
MEKSIYFDLIFQPKMLDLLPYGSKIEIQKMLDFA